MNALVLAAGAGIVAGAHAPRNTTPKSATAVRGGRSACSGQGTCSGQSTCMGKRAPSK